MTRLIFMKCLWILMFGLIMLDKIMDNVHE